MRRTKIMVATIALTLGMCFSAYAKDIKINKQLGDNGKVEISGKSLAGEDVTIKVVGEDKIYYLDQVKTSDNGDFKFKFVVDSDKDYSGTLNVGGEKQEIKFSTKKSDEKPVVKPSKPSGGAPGGSSAPSSGGSSGGSSSSSGGGVSSKQPEKQPEKPVENKKAESTKIRLGGKDRFNTCVNIAERFRKENGGKIENVVIASANGYADALSGSVLAKQTNSPMLLMGKSVKESKTTIDYIKKHLNKQGKIYILGGNGSVSEEFIKEFKASGYSTNNIIRLGGKNRIETCNVIANKLHIKKGTSIVLASANGFADALSISVPAASKEYPILLTNKDSLSQDVKDMISKIEPSNIYVVGGQGVISENIEKQVKSLSKNTNITRLGGKNRYETSYKIVQKFKQDKNKTLLVASGDNFPDALSGAALGAKLNGQLILVNDSSIDKQKELIDTLNVEEHILLGGNASISERVENKLKR